MRTLSHGLLIVASLLVLVAPMTQGDENSGAKAAPLLRDTFDNTAEPNSDETGGCGLNRDLASRQFGTSGAVSYVRGGDYTAIPWWTQVGKASAAQSGKLNIIAGYGKAGWLALDRSFPRDVSVSIVAQPAASHVVDANSPPEVQENDRRSYDSWVALGIRGRSASFDAKALPKAADAGAVLLIRAGGKWSYYENGTLIVEGSVPVMPSYQVTVQVVGDQLAVDINERAVNLNPGGSGMNRTLCGSAAETEANYISLGAGNVTDSVDAADLAKWTGLDCSLVDDLTMAACSNVQGEARIRLGPSPVSQLLTSLDVWVLPEPKSVTATGGPFDLASCRGIRLAGATDAASGLAAALSDLLKERSGVSVTTAAPPDAAGAITLGLFSPGTPPTDLPGIAAADLEHLKPQGYVVHIDADGIAAAATDVEGLRYAVQTIAQIATDRTVLPGVHIRDWPSLRYRGVQYDVSRGQMPTIDTLQRVADVLAEAKSNMLELYIEDVFQWKRHPDIAPPEAITADEARSLSEHAARRGIEVHPMLQVLGHFGAIGQKPAYKDLMVPEPPGGIEGHPWTLTVDVRKPEAVALVVDLMNEICDAFPCKFVNVDVTEIADYGYTQSGTKAEDLPQLMLDYFVKLRDVLAKRGTRLMIAQGQLDATGHLNGIGAVLDKLPKDIAVGSYYTAEFYGGWDKDFPRLQKEKVDLFAMPWIDSHGHIMPFVGHAMDFSDITICRGLRFGAIGSITDDWGDDGHYHLPSTTWYPYLYHAASAWTGAQLDRDYFNQAFSRLLFGTKNDQIARAVLLAGNINGQPMKLKDAKGQIMDWPPYVGNSRFGRYYYEFFADPFSDPKVLEIAEPGEKGREILQPADEAAGLLTAARAVATRNQNALDELLFTVKNYQAIGKKLVARDRYLDQNVPRSQVAKDLAELANTYEGLREEFKRLWLAGCKDNAGFHRHVGRFDNTITPCKKVAAELQGK